MSHPKIHSYHEKGETISKLTAKFKYAKPIIRTSTRDVKIKTEPMINGADRQTMGFRNILKLL